jgi:hypothetical protein
VDVDCPAYNELCRRNSTSATNVGSTHVALGFSTGLVRFDFANDGIELLSDLAGHRAGPARPDLAHVDQVIPFPLPEVKRGDAPLDL